ncbi:hypothetical protein GALMADRAFT_723711 [Galerina marginata CBS 339.88]|uniref:Nephrocystin 3-like N-terminal domain-containing protein n=1 Tax=Galerina marginata (strain CBS 339.88) TaxID=685588 RepID=A0A067ST03_GALM3|nr:hypothetical protein GALMADRAFT_723711 [Galerina marginata CBS 339.88]
MFSYAHIGAVTGGTFTTVEGDFHTHYNASGDIGLGGIRLLHGHIAVGAFHNSAERFDPPKCHPSTRKSILKRIMDWVRDDDKTHPFLWLYGPAGSGKTSIAQSIAELCEEEGILAGDFFFSRTSPGRNDDRHLIPTLAYQLTISIPGIREYMVEALDRDALVFSRSIKAQLETLIVKPLTELLASSRKKGIVTKRQPGLIIIDGLDECGQPKSQRYILSVLSSVIKESSIPLFFFIASRAEQDIRDVFNGQEMCSLSHRLVLDDTCDPDADVRIFLESRFEEIKKGHPSGSFLPARWPHYSDIDRLVRKSSGQFIYASTVLKFVESSRHWPPDRLNIIFGLTPPGANTPFAELDALYTHILSSVEDIERVLEIFSFLFFKESNVKSRMDLVESFLFFRRGELQMVLSDLHSIIYVPPPGDGSRSLRMYHASLRDFLMDKSRSGRFSLDAGLAYARLAMHCIKHMTFPRLTSAPSLLRLTGYTGLMQYCMNAYPTAALLEGLYQFNFEAFLGLRIKTENDVALRGFFHILPSFFEWIRAQHGYPNDKNDLYDRYLAHFDGYLKAKLSEYPRKPTTLHLFTASTLNGFDVYSRIP